MDGVGFEPTTTDVSVLYQPELPAQQVYCSISRYRCQGIYGDLKKYFGYSLQAGGIQGIVPTVPDVGIVGMVTFGGICLWVCGLREFWLGSLLPSENFLVSTWRVFDLTLCVR